MFRLHDICLLHEMIAGSSAAGHCCLPSTASGLEGFCGRDHRISSDFAIRIIGFVVVCGRDHRIRSILLSGSSDIESEDHRTLSDFAIGVIGFVVFCGRAHRIRSILQSGSSNS